MDITDQSLGSSTLQWALTHTRVDRTLVWSKRRVPKEKTIVPYLPSCPVTWVCQELAEDPISKLEQKNWEDHIFYTLPWTWVVDMLAVYRKEVMLRWLYAWGRFIAIEAKGCDVEVRLTRRPIFNYHAACINFTPTWERHSLPSQQSRLECWWPPWSLSSLRPLKIWWVFLSLIYYCIWLIYL